MKKILKYSIALLLPIIFMVGCEEDFEDKLTGNPPSDNSVDVSSRLSGFEQDEAEIGATLTMTGQGLSNVKRVMVAGRLALNVEASETAVSFTVPNGAPLGAQDFHFIFSGNERAVANIVVIPRQIPGILSISPTAAAAGEQVTIVGFALKDIQSIKVGGVEAEADDASTEEKLIITIPEGLPPNVPAPIEIETVRGKVTSESIFYVGKNLIANGEFEQGEGEDFEGWHKANNGTLTIADPADSYAGRTLKAISGSASQQWHPQMFAPATPTQIGAEYTLIVWVKGAVGTPGDGGRIRFSTTPNAKYSGNYDITSQWQQLVWVFEANAESTQIVLDLGGVEDAVYFLDNVTLVATGDAAPQPVELLLNGGFELGDGDDFTNWSKNNGADFLTATTNENEVRSGSRALFAVGDGRSHWRTQLASDVMETIEGRTYVASFWIKAKLGTPGNGGIVRMSTAGNGDPQYQGDVTVNTTTDWQKVEWEITANGTETSIVLDLGATENAEYFIDDVSFLQMPE